MIAVPPTVHRTLDQASLLSQVRIELCKRPADGIALAFVVQAITLVLLFLDARTRVDAVLLFEFRTELVDVDRLDVAADGVLHLDAISRVLECNPLYTGIVLAYNQWGGRRDGPGSRA